MLRVRSQDELFQAACLQLLAALSLPALPAEEPFLIYPQAVRQPKGLDQHRAGVIVSEKQDVVKDVTETRTTTVVYKLGPGTVHSSKCNSSPHSTIVFAKNCRLFCTRAHV